MGPLDARMRHQQGVFGFCKFFGGGLEQGRAGEEGFNPVYVLSPNDLMCLWQEPGRGTWAVWSLSPGMYVVFFHVIR